MINGYPKSVPHSAADVATPPPDLRGAGGALATSQALPWASSARRLCYQLSEREAPLEPPPPLRRGRYQEVPGSHTIPGISPEVC